jgi:hypothetical protein
MRMRRSEKKLFIVLDEIAQLDGVLDQLRQELSMHQHLHDDARRDALVTDDPIDREDARITRQDVDRVLRELKRLESQRSKLDTRRIELLTSLETR